MRILSLDTECVENKESMIILKWMSLNDENEIEYSLRPELERHNWGWGVFWCGSGSVNVQFDINLATTVTAVRG
jgi:hypothetical protein